MIRSARIAFAIAAIVTLFPASAVPRPMQAGGPGPSFACSATASPTEKIICADPQLRALDREMAQLFGLARESGFGSGPSNQLAAQRTALQRMRNCPEGDTARPRAACLRDSYRARTQALATAVLLKAPAIAIPILRRNDPAFAPILEAVQLWAEAPAEANWAAPERAQSRARIAALLAPYLHALQTNADQRFGNDIVQDPGKDGVAVRTIDDIFRSDRHFAALLQVLGPYLEQSATPDLTRDLPCAAIVRHPKLLAATGPVFGSTMDSFVFGNDCRESLPPLPSLEALETKLWRGWPECEGTIRFAYFRGFASDMDRARLGLSPRAKTTVLAARRGITRSDTSRAEQALTAYYVAYLHRDPAAAARAARDALVEIMADAQVC